MPTTKPLLTKSTLHWPITIRPSRLFARLYVTTYCASLLAIGLCPLPVGYKLVLALVTTAGAAAIFHRSNRVTTLCLLENDQWLFENHTGRIAGHIAPGSYRSTYLVVLALRPDQARTVHVAVWRDAVQPEAFSQLHMRLMLTSAEQH